MPETAGGIGRVVDTAGMETITGHTRLAAEQEEVNEEPKRSREDEAEEEWMLRRLANFRHDWTRAWSEYFGDVEKRIEAPPMRFSQEPAPSYAKLLDALQIFSVGVLELKGTMCCWPIDVFGFIAMRDSLYQNHNYIFERTREDCQTLTAEVPPLFRHSPSIVFPSVSLNFAFCFPVCVCVSAPQNCNFTFNVINSRNYLG